MRLALPESLDVKRKMLLDEDGIKLEIIENDSGLHDYGIPRQAWLRGVRLMQHFGPQRALDLIDQRAEQAADRADYDTARRWRDLITAIHALQEDERLAGDNVH